MQKTFETPGPTSLYVEVGAGTVSIQADEVAQTTVDVQGRNAEEVTVDQRGDQIVVIAPQRRSGFFGGGSNEFQVHVTMPSDSRLATKLGSADVSVAGRIGETSIKSGSGDVQVAEITDSADIQTGSGDVQVDSVGGDLRVKAGSGDVQLGRVHGDASVSTGSGDVQIGYAASPVEVKSGSGDLRVRDAHEDVALTTASGDLLIDVMRRGQLLAKNVSGDIRVGIPAGVPVWTDVSSMTGSVSSSLEGAGQPEEGQDYIELRAKTISGDIVLEQL
jgi:DUF4097 and DUF4098 domain-containing protein YvlB